MRNDFDLSGKVAVVTGASQGLGAGLAKELAGLGAIVVLCARNEGALRAVGEEIALSGGRADVIPLDVANVEAVRAAFEAIAAKHGTVDILLNNAGTEEVADFIEVAEEQYDKIMDVNLRGAFFAAQAAARIMKEKGCGKILNVGSLGSAIGLAGSAVYCGTKSGILGITRSMAIELARYNIQVNAIGPGYFRTPMTEPFFQDPGHRAWIEGRIPAGRVGAIEDLIGSVVFLCSAAANYVTGQVLYVDGGWLAS